MKHRSPPARYLGAGRLGNSRTLHAGHDVLPRALGGDIVTARGAAEARMVRRSACQASLEIGQSTVDLFERGVEINVLSDVRIGAPQPSFGRRVNDFELPVQQ